MEEIDEETIDLKKYFTEKLLKGILGYALTQFYKNDIELMDYETEKAAVSERCMVFHIGWYIFEKIKTCNGLSAINVDCEYNRNKGDAKRLLKNNNKKSTEEQDSSPVIPDLLIHQRKNNDNNLLVAEFKKNKNFDEQDDYKLRGFTSESYDYRYKFGVYIDLHKDKKAKIQLYKNGKPSTKWQYKMIKDSAGNIAWKITEE